MLRKDALLILFFFCFCFSYSQSKLNITGKIIDANSNQPLEFASVALLKLNDSTIVGTTTDKNGFFKIKILADTYTVNFSFLGYKPHEIKSKKFDADYTFGTIKLQNDNTLKEVDVIAQRKLTRIEFNKVIYSASADVANKGTNALGVLNNTPTVNVDETGNAYVRGNQALILMDGKILKETNIQDLLNSIPGNTIKEVEIISNATKYSAEGGTVINLISKKGNKNTFSGTVEARAGIAPEDHGGSVFLSRNFEKVNFFSTLSFNHLNNDAEITFKQPSLNVHQNSKEDYLNNSYLINIGSDLFLSKKSTLTPSILVAHQNKNNVFDINEPTYKRLANQGIDNINYEARLDYKLKINDKGEKLALSTSYNSFDSEDAATILETSTVINDIDQKYTKDQKINLFEAKIDYTLPFSETSYVEFGYNANFRDYTNSYNAAQLNTLTNNFETLENLDDTYNYKENIHGLYAQYTNASKAITYTLGLRGEASAIKTNDYGVTAKKDYIDIFPSIDVSYEFGETNFLQASYSRSITRPKETELSPFNTYIYQRFQNIGNQNLNPYYSNFFLLLYNKEYKKLSLTGSLYANLSKNRFLASVENSGLFTANGDQIFKRSQINSGNFNIYGVDLELTYRPTKKIHLYGYVSPTYEETIKAINPAHNNKNNALFAQGALTLLFNKGIRFNFSQSYQSARKTGMMELAAVTFSTATLSKSLFNNKATLTLKGVDLFNSFRAKRTFTSNGIVTQRDLFKRKGYTLTFTYNFNQKTKNRKDRSKDVTKDRLNSNSDEKIQ